MSSSTNYRGNKLPVPSVAAKLDQTHPLWPNVPELGKWPVQYSFTSQYLNNRIWILRCPEFGLKVKAKNCGIAEVKLRSQIKIIEQLYIIFRLGRKVTPNGESDRPPPAEKSSKKKERGRRAYARPDHQVPRPGSTP